MPWYGMVRAPCHVTASSGSYGTVLYDIARCGSVVEKLGRVRQKHSWTYIVIVVGAATCFVIPLAGERCVLVMVAPSG